MFNTDLTTRVEHAKQSAVSNFSVYKNNERSVSVKIADF